MSAFHSTPEEESTCQLKRHRICDAACSMPCLFPFICSPTCTYTGWLALCVVFCQLCSAVQTTQHILDVTKLTGAKGWHHAMFVYATKQLLCERLECHTSLEGGWPHACFMSFCLPVCSAIVLLVASWQSLSVHKCTEQHSTDKARSVDRHHKGMQGSSSPAVLMRCKLSKALQICFGRCGGIAGTGWKVPRLGL